MRKVTDKELIEAYTEDRNIWKVAKRFNMCGQSVWERLRKLNISLNYPKFTEKEKLFLKKNCESYANRGKLQELANLMGRTKHFICRQANYLSLTKQKGNKKYLEFPENKIIKLFNKFKKTKRLTLKQFCRKYNIGEVTFCKHCKRLFPDEWDNVIELRKPAGKYKLGRAFEYRVKDFLKGKGFWVIRSPRSAGIVDLIALKKGLILFIQCKRNGQLSLEERNELFELSESVGAIPLLAGMPGARGITFWKITEKAMEKGQGRIMVDNFDEEVDITL